MIGISRAWDEQKIWVPDRIRTYDLSNPDRAGVLSTLSYGELMEFELQHQQHQQQHFAYK